MIPSVGLGAGDLDATTRGKLANLQAALGDAYREVREPHEAIEAYRKALDRCPGFHDIRHGSGWHCARRGFRTAPSPSSAASCTTGVARRRRAGGLTLYTLGRADALAEWETVLEQNPHERTRRCTCASCGPLSVIERGRRSRRISPAALRPQAPITPPPGWVPAPQR